MMQSYFVSLNSMGVPKGMNWDALVSERILGKKIGLNPSPGRMERTFSGVKGSPVAMSWTA